MDLHEYQTKALATAEPRAFHLAYLVPGLLGEVGELFGHQAKGYWHHRYAAEQAALVQKEYGDIAWITAVLLHTEGVTQLEVPATFAAGWNGQKPDPMALVLSGAAQVHNAYLNRPHYDWMQEAAQRMWYAVVTQCEAVTGTDLDTVLQINLDKLASRAARGLLQGAGDNR